MSFIHHYGWLGSAPQNGFGTVRIDPARIDPAPDAPVIPTNNPIFFAQDLTLNQNQLNNLKFILKGFYSEKCACQESLFDAESDKGKKGTLNKQIKRYQDILGFIEIPSCPIGYEIRRYLKYIFSEDCKMFGKPGNTNGHASHIHVSHPVAVAGNGFSIRLRFCARPTNSCGITPPRVKSDLWVASCVRKITSLANTTPTLPSVSGASNGTTGGSGGISGKKQGEGKAKDKKELTHSPFAALAGFKGGNP